MTVAGFEEITTDEPEKSLVESLRTPAQQPGAHHDAPPGWRLPKLYRKIGFKRDKHGVPGWPPSNTTRTGAPHRPHPPDGGATFSRRSASRSAIRSAGKPVRIGSTIPLANIPSADDSQHRELTWRWRASGSDYAVVRMPSGELRRIHVRCQATIGQVGNIEHENESGGKAGRSRWLGVRPTVRGSTMNPRDHPHGGGEGKTGPGGNPKTPWGKPALGYRTRKPKKASDKLIIRRREKKGRKK